MELSIITTKSSSSKLWSVYSPCMKLDGFLPLTNHITHMHVEFHPTFYCPVPLGYSLSAAHQAVPVLSILNNCASAAAFVTLLLIPFPNHVWTSWTAQIPVQIPSLVTSLCHKSWPFIAHSVSYALANYLFILWPFHLCKWPQSREKD